MWLQIILLDNFSRSKDLTKIKLNESTMQLKIIYRSNIFLSLAVPIRIRSWRVNFYFAMNQRNLTWPSRSGYKGLVISLEHPTVYDEEKGLNLEKKKNGVKMENTIF